MILCGAIPVYLNTEINAKLGIVLGVTGKEVEKTIQEHPNAVAVLVNNPTYYGICSDIKGICDIAHSYGLKVLADEAHGTHLYFGDNLPKEFNESRSRPCKEYQCISQAVRLRRVQSFLPIMV